MNTAPRLLGGRYEVGEVLGRGGMAEVHLGRDTRLGRAVAVKLLRSDLARDPSFQARFRREAQSAASLNHPAVVAVYDSGEEPADDGSGVPRPYIVMEYVEGRTLREMLTRSTTLPWSEALRITSGVLAALGYSHRAGIVHRDIKPANVMVTPTGDVKVMDFGIARAVADSSATMTQTQAVIGTAQYLSPEQARGETVDARSDLYSTGCLLFELVTGRPPFVADSPVAVAYQHVGEAPKPPSSFNVEVPVQVDAIVVHALVKDRAGRYQTAEQFRADVDAALAGRRVSSAALGSAAALVGSDGPAQAAATHAMASIPPLTPRGGQPAVAPVPVAAPTPATQRVATVLPPGRDDDRDPERSSRAGVWVLLGLLAAALIALGVLVLPSLMGDDTPTVQTVQVPDVTGRTEAQARTALTALGLVPAIEQATSDEVPRGSVVQQSPLAAISVPRGSDVTLTVSTGRGTATVPDLVGQTAAQADALLKAQGLVLGEVDSQESTEPKNTVLSSRPGAGETATKGTGVALTVSSGSVQVPNVIGRTLPDAIETLVGAGLKVGEVTNVDSTQPEGTVTDQAFSAKTVPLGTEVKLFVARMAPTPTVTPTPTPTDTVTPFPTVTPTDAPTDVPTDTPPATP